MCDPEDVVLYIGWKLYEGDRLILPEEPLKRGKQYRVKVFVSSVESQSIVGKTFSASLYPVYGYITLVDPIQEEFVVAVDKTGRPSNDSCVYLNFRVKDNLAANVEAVFLLHVFYMHMIMSTIGIKKIVV